MIIMYQNYITMSNLVIFITIIFLGCISGIANGSGGNTNEWKYGCYDATAYKGDNTIISPSEFGGDSFTCAQWYGHLVQNDQILNGITYNSSLTCSKVPAISVGALNVMAKYCCTGTTSICTGDPKYMCKNASTFTPNKIINPPTGNEDTCLNHATYNTITDFPFNAVAPFNSTTKCSDFSTTTSTNNNIAPRHLLSILGAMCCSDEQTVCYVDYSKICADPTKYTGTKKMGTDFSLMKCNAFVEMQSAISTIVFYGTNWSNVTSCGDITSNVTDEHGATGTMYAGFIAKECCSDQTGVCESIPFDTAIGGIWGGSIPGARGGDWLARTKCFMLKNMDETGQFRYVVKNKKKYLQNISGEEHFVMMPNKMMLKHEMSHYYNYSASGIAGAHSVWDMCSFDKRINECPHFELFSKGTLYSKVGFIGHQWESNATWILEWMQHHNDLKNLMMCFCECPLGLVFPPGNEVCMKLGINSTFSASLCIGST